MWENESNIKKVFKIQKKTVRILSNKGPREHCKIPFRNLKVMTIPSFYIHDCIMYKNNNMDKIKLNKDVHEYDTRNKENAHIKFYLSVQNVSLYYFITNYQNV